MTATRVRLTADELDGAVEWDVAFRVHAGGIVDALVLGADVPDVRVDVDADGGELTTDAEMVTDLRLAGWEPLNGWSGQYGYRGPVMHPSEYLGGSLAQHVLDTPGLYALVAVETSVSPDPDPDGEWESGEPAGWLILRRLETATCAYCRQAVQRVAPDVDTWTTGAPGGVACPTTSGEVLGHRPDGTGARS